jgi:hypothetical protein
MITSLSVVALVTSLGWLFLNWRSFRASAASQGWTTNRQLQIAAIWIVIIAGLTVLFQQFGA